MFLTPGSSWTPLHACAVTFQPTLALTLPTPGSVRTASISARRRPSTAAGRIAQLDLEGDIAALDLQVLADGFAGDERPAGVGIDHGLDRGADGVLVQGHDGRASGDHVEERHGRMLTARPRRRCKVYRHLVSPAALGLVERLVGLAQHRDAVGARRLAAQPRRVTARPDTLCRPGARRSPAGCAGQGLRGDRSGTAMNSSPP